MPLTPRPSALNLSIAALSVVMALALGVRLGLQLSALGAARGDLADAQRTAAELARTAAQGVGPPLFDAGARPAGDALAQRLQGLGLAVRKTDEVAATPAGRDLALVRFVVDARADPAAVDRLALWVEANARSAILEQLTAGADADGKGDVRLELDALVRQHKAPAP
jgi:hypothetical protein